MSEENDFQSSRPYTLFYYPSSRLPPRVMSQVQLCRFWCLLDRDGEDAFVVGADLEWDVSELTEAIQEKKTYLHGRDTSDIILLKLNEPIPVDPEETLPQRLPKPITDSSVKLNRTDQVSDAFPYCPKHLQIIVTLRAAGGLPKRRRVENEAEGPPKPVGTFVQRDATVAALYARLRKYGFIQVRGTPGSGKTTLGQLLGQHIYYGEPDIHVIWVNGWQRRDVRKAGGARKYLHHVLGWREGQNTVFIFDEAQLSYWDMDLWTGFFKGIKGNTPDRWTIAFASYGSASSLFKIKGTLIRLNDMQRVTLRAIDHDDALPAVGLLFSQDEMDDLVSVLYPSSHHYFDPSFFVCVFRITGGHIGAICDFLEVVAADDSYCELKNFSGELYTWKRFLKRIGTRDLLKKLTTSSCVFARGLPEKKDLQDLVVARIFSAVLCYNYVTTPYNSSDSDEDSSNPDNNSPNPGNIFPSSKVQRCFRRGWLHSDKLSAIGQEDRVGFFFPSLLHRWYLEWNLWETLPKAHFTTNGLLDFVIRVVSCFSPTRLAETRRLASGGSQQIPEAHYQDEFYMNCHICSKGSTLSFPEYGTMKGRVDFYIPAEKWGVELLREGDRLAQHSGRFSSNGAYKKDFSPSKYVILDCRQTHPQVPHQYLANLYHIVFSDNFEELTILDNRLKQVPHGHRLLTSS